MVLKEDSLTGVARRTHLNGRSHPTNHNKAHSLTSTLRCKFEQNWKWSASFLCHQHFIWLLLLSAATWKYLHTEAAMILNSRVSTVKKNLVKVKVWTLAIAPLTWVRLVISSALQSRKWQLIGMSQWCRSALCGHPLPALTDNWTHGAASRHTIAPINHTRPSPHSRSYYSFPVPLRVVGWVGLSTQ